MAAKYYKCLNGLKACHGGSCTYELGVWTPEIEDIEECKRGYHICTAEQLVHWLASDIYECEAEGVLELSDKCVAKRIQLVRKVETWNEKTARLFAVWCARQVQHLMKDERSITALDVAERYANGEATDDELAAATRAAWAAAWDAARAAAWAAARAAARAAWAAARDAAWAAARDAAWAAAWDAAWAAAWDAARAADAAGTARTKQSAKLKEMLGIS